ncbi:MAG: YwqG family protein [Methylomonas sp.]|jgi:hypothetical protein|uniref:DUF1963 domain-containing protein n=1 Tax=Methylomonas sp. TaxID=418 RepID=UPI0025EDE584|nr:DUF1963 domain-containing protein [Methylomonas sp.]MCK9608226.1 YwqG family protein [Methylomonas sp.]
MNLVAERCSEGLLHKLGIPPISPEWSYLNPIGLPIAYDIAEQIALIAYPDHYAKGSNRFYRLFIGSIWLNIKEKDATEKDPEKIIEVLARDTEDYFDIELLEQAIQKAFAAFNDRQGSSFRIAIQGREIFRSPQPIIDHLNRFAEMASATQMQTAEENFTPILVKPEELEKFTDYVKQTSWAGLSKPARKLVERAIKRIEREQKKANEQAKRLEEVVTMLECRVDLGPKLKKLCDDKVIWKYVCEYCSRRRDGVWMHRDVPHEFEQRSRSYLGGIPSLNSHADWPYDNQGRRAFFVGQLDCAEINRLVPGHLPDTGVLCFFADQDLERGWDENHTRKCYLVHVDRDVDCISNVPDDYLEPGDWFNLVESIGPFFSAFEKRAVNPMLWPRMNLKAHKFATLEDWSYFCDSELLDFDDDSEMEDRKDNLCELLDQINKQYQRRKITSILGPKPKGIQPIKLFPKTVPVYFFQHLEKPFTTYEIGFPWSRMHITRTILEILSKTREEFDSLIKGHLSGLKELLGLDSRYRNQYSWGYGEIKEHPDYLLNTDDFQALDESVKTQHPDLYNGFQYWLELEHLYRQAVTYYEEFVDEPYEEPTTEEKAHFIDWVAGWINHGCARGGIRLAHLIESKGDPVWQTPYSIPRVDTSNSDKTYYQFFGDRLHWACLSALNAATALCVGNSAEAAARIPIQAFNDLLPNDDIPLHFHKCLGYGDCIQHAADKFKVKVLLLEVQNDRYLFSNFGSGALQFWISSEDLKAMRFDKAFMTAECT